MFYQERLQDKNKLRVEYYFVCLMPPRSFFVIKSATVPLLFEPDSFPPEDRREAENTEGCNADWNTGTGENAGQAYHKL